MTGHIQGIANSLPYYFEAQDLGTHRQAEKLMEIFENGSFFSSTSDLSAIHFLRSFSRIVVYSGISLFSLLEDLFSGKLYTDNSQSELRAIAVEAIGFSILHPFTPLEIPSDLIALLRHADSVQHEGQVYGDQEIKALQHGAILKTLGKSDPNFLERLYSTNSSTALPSLQCDLSSVLATLHQAGHLRDPNEGFKGHLNPFLAKVESIAIEKDELQKLGRFYQFAQRALPDFIQELLDSNIFPRHQQALNDIVESLEIDMADMFLGNMAQLFELLNLDRTAESSRENYSPFESQVFQKRRRELLELQASYQRLNEGKQIELLTSLLIGVPKISRDVQPIRDAIVRLAEIFYGPILDENHIKSVMTYSSTAKPSLLWTKIRDVATRV